jgi:hypothetical protein
MMTPEVAAVIMVLAIVAGLCSLRDLDRIHDR